jgi:hypothetical protein
MAWNPNDKAEATLASGITNASTVLSLTGPHVGRFSSSGDYTVEVVHPSNGTNELIKIASKSGSNLNVAPGGRGFGVPSTTALAFPSGSVVRVVVDRATLDGIGGGRPGVVHNGTTDPNGVAPNVAPANMTSNTSPAPFVASSSGNFPGYDPFYAFNAVLANQYWIGNGVTGFLRIDLGSNSTIVQTYRVQVNDIPEPTRAPKDWTLEGSNDGTTWTVIDTVINETGWTTGQERSFVCDVTTTAYRYYQINISANNGDGSFIQVANLKLLGTATPFTSAINGDWYMDTVTRKLYGPYTGGGVWNVFSTLPLP